MKLARRGNLVTGRAAAGTDTCPHGELLDKCQESWCRSRMEDLESGQFEAKAIEAPETTEELIAVESIQPKSETSWRDHLAEVESIDFAVRPPWKSPGPPGSHWCSDCLKWWTGLRPEHCTVCHETFGSETAGIQHRYGKYNPPGHRHCRTPLWMQNKDWWQDSQGVWRLPKPDKNPFQKED